GPSAAGRGRLPQRLRRGHRTPVRGRSPAAVITSHFYTNVSSGVDRTPFGRKLPPHIRVNLSLSLSYPSPTGRPRGGKAPRPFVLKEKDLWLYRRLPRKCISRPAGSTAPSGRPNLTLKPSLM